MTQHSLNKDGYDRTSVNAGRRFGLAEPWTGPRGQAGIPSLYALLNDVCDAANLDQFGGWRRLP
jgi:hypothetical protein